MAITKIVDDVRTTTALDATKVTTGTMDAARIGSGTLADARISQASVVQHSPPADLTAVRQDIAMLALYNAVSDNRAAYNLPYSFIDQFEDDTGTTTRTTVSNVDEYFASIASVSGYFTGAAIDAQTSLLIQSDSQTNGSSAFTDLSSNGFTIEKQGLPVHSTAKAKMGTSSILFNGSSGLKIAWNAALQYNADFTIEFWGNSPDGTTGDRIMSHWPDHHTSNGGQWFIRTTSNDSAFFNLFDLNYQASGADSFSDGNWHHIVFQREGSNLRGFIDGINRINASGISTATTGNRQYTTIGYSYQGPGEFVTNLTYVDQIRISKGVARYPGTTTFTPPQDSSTTSATGTLVSDVQTAPAATTKMSGVILYKDAGSGATTLGTQLKIYLTANLQGTSPNWTGTDWKEVVAGDFGAVTPLFSAGVKMVRIAEQTVVSGTACAMKAVWASQASGTMESQLHGWAMNY